MTEEILEKRTLYVEEKVTHPNASLHLIITHRNSSFNELKIMKDKKTGWQIRDDEEYPLDEVMALLKQYFKDKG